jgi:hypothetical protein
MFLSLIDLPATTTAASRYETRALTSLNSSAAGNSPTVLISLASKIQTTPVRPAFVPHSLSVQKKLTSVFCFFPPANDISVGSHNIIRVRQNLAGAHEVLTTSLYIRDALLVGRPPPYDSRLLPQASHDGERDERKHSLLGCIVSMDRQAVERREQLAGVLQSGVVEGGILKIKGSPGYRKAMRKLAMKKEEVVVSRKSVVANVQGTLCIALVSFLFPFD